MGCCSVTARGNKSTPDGHEEAELLHRDESRKQSEVGSPNGGTCISAQQVREILTSENVGSYSVEDKQFKSKPVLFWGKTREHLNDQIFKEPIRGWEGQHVYSYGRVVMSSLVVIQISSTQEMSECFLVLFPLHLLILSMDNQERRFIYQGLLPLSGMSVLCTQTSTGHTFQINGPMIEPRQVTCLNYNDKNLWISTLQDHIHEANIHSSPVTPCLSILSYLVPCDKLWKKNELMQYLTSCPIQLWEGKAIQHMGKAIFLSTVQVSHTIDGAYEERILVLFPDDLVFLSVDPDRTTVTHQGTLPLNAVRVYESLAWNGRLEFQITGEFMEPILISCMTASDYNQWIFHLQKPEQDNCTVNLRPLISLPARYRR